MLNRVTLIGYLGKDPEVRFTGNGNAVCKFSMATSERWTNANGEKQESTEWHNVIVWGKEGENAGKYLLKGRLVCVEGKIQTRTYDDKDGNKRWITEIVARHVTYMPDKDREGGTRERAPERSDRRPERSEERRPRRDEGDPEWNQEPPEPTSRGGSSGHVDSDDDIPF